MRKWLVLAAVILTSFGAASVAEAAGGGPTGPTSRAACMNGGWENYPALGFKGQGDCIAYVQKPVRRK